MSFFKKINAPKEVQALLGVLDEIACRRVGQTGISIPIANTWHDSEAFQIVRNHIENLILARPEWSARIIQEQGISPRQWVWQGVANFAGDLVESGQYHIYRGALNPMGPGEDLVQLFDMAVDELTRMGVLQPDYAEKQKAGLRENIRTVG